MSIQDLGDAEIEAFIGNYRRLGLSEGGKYSLSELLLEQKRRSPSDMGGRRVCEIILASRASDGFLSYKDLWAAGSPGVPWTGHKSLGRVTKWLDQAIHYCVTNSLPVLTVLVVRENSRKLSPDAVDNIYGVCRELGVEVGLDPSAFVAAQITAAKRFDPADLV